MKIPIKNKYQSPKFDAFEEFKNEFPGIIEDKLGENDKIGEIDLEIMGTSAYIEWLEGKKKIKKNWFAKMFWQSYIDDHLKYLVFLEKQFRRFSFLKRRLESKDTIKLRSIDDFKADNPLKDTIGKYFEIKNNKISCLKHEDKTPSLHIYQDRFYCFSCGWRGDVIDFLKEVEKCDLKTLLMEY